jgi:hypothetical protein
MHVIEARNVEQAVHIGLRYLSTYGERSESRNGSVIVAPGPVATVYQNPAERVLFWPLRDANPFFHLMESLWMLAGRNDVALPAHFAKQIREYSDDGESLNGAYGYRWRIHFGTDQIRRALERLQADPLSRQALIQMYDPYEDLLPTKDVPCNTVIYFRVLHHALHMTVSCRSNDVIWGAYGANAVHFSFLQEFMAAQLGLAMGTYTQISNNYHIYERHYDLMHAKYSPIFDYPEPIEPLDADQFSYFDFMDDLGAFLAKPETHYPKSKFLREVAQPMYVAWNARKNKTSTGLPELENATRCDWVEAAKQWINRRT